MDLRVGDLIELWIAHGINGLHCYVGIYLGEDRRAPNMGRILENGRPGLFNPQFSRIRVLHRAPTEF